MTLRWQTHRFGEVCFVLKVFSAELSGIILFGSVHLRAVVSQTGRGHWSDLGLLAVLVVILVVWGPTWLCLGGQYL